jgi:DNA polymerase III subunit gamma/tau
LIARSARGSFRDAVSTLDQLAAATSKSVDAQAVLQLVGAVDEESLLRLCDMVVDRDTAGALVFIEELAERGQDLGRLVTDLLASGPRRCRPSSPRRRKRRRARSSRRRRAAGWLP